jgi:hypothetical protein
MNYKICITAENQAIVKRIADENEMNPYLYAFLNFGIFYNIIDNKFDNIFVQNATELTTEQFIELFDKKETEPHICKYCQAETTQDDETCYAKPTEWRPKRGDRVLVWDDDEKLAEERIFLVKIEGCKLAIRTVAPGEDTKFFKGEEFSSSGYKYMKPLPIEQLKETDFKTKVIELIEGEINDLKVYEKRQIEINEYYNNHSSVASKIKVYNNLLNQIKQL